jgi:hypothetical protein
MVYLFDLDLGLARTIEGLLGSTAGSLAADLNGQEWPAMPPIFTWIYQHVIRDLR